MTAEQESAVETVILDTRKRDKAIVRLANAMGEITKVQSLTAMEMYFYAVYFLGGMAGMNGLLPRDPNTFRLFRAGYDDFHKVIARLENQTD